MTSQRERRLEALEGNHGTTEEPPRESREEKPLTKKVN
jgi:hypothetical protein